METFSIHPIGYVRERDGSKVLEVLPEYRPALDKLDEWGHVVSVWWFSGSDNPDTRSILRQTRPHQSSPGEAGTFATRSPRRPNPIGLTVAKIDRVDVEQGLVVIDRHDALPDTPLLDIKPYSPGSDRVEAPILPEWAAHWPKSREESAVFDWAKEDGKA
ncbi:TrmO family methyltransferase domain-containing protein [Stomatohabitans albus]|uniref:TrmO family methyltransferase domain-containing protein n=1 Tax=Stomatohabitans albus TaxID=3110766 RepID=UPI00300CA1CC